MKNLFIIGNGFDIHHKLDTRYQSFANYLAENNSEVYELLLNEYNNGELKTETIGSVSISYKQLDNGHIVVADKTAYDSILAKTGTAWYYLLDLDSRTFVLPQTNGYMKYGNSNQFIKQRLPLSFSGDFHHAKQNKYKISK